MFIYSVIEIESTYSDNLVVSSTDPGLVKWAINLIEEWYPEIKHASYKWFGEETESIAEHFHFRKRGFELISKRLATELARELLQEGWEPQRFSFGADSYFQLIKKTELD